MCYSGCWIRLLLIMFDWGQSRQCCDVLTSLTEVGCKPSDGPFSINVVGGFLFTIFEVNGIWILWYSQYSKYSLNIPQSAICPQYPKHPLKIPQSVWQWNVFRFCGFAFGGFFKFFEILGKEIPLKVLIFYCSLECINLEWKKWQFLCYYHFWVLYLRLMVFEHYDFTIFKILIKNSAKCDLPTISEILIKNTAKCYDWLLVGVSWALFGMFLDFVVGNLLIFEIFPKL